MSFEPSMPHLIEMWQKQLENINLDKINNMINSNEITFFFTIDKQYFAADENNRISFCEIKEEKDKERTFTAYNLSSFKKEGVFVKRLFDYNHIKKIKVLDINKIKKEFLNVSK